jgi:oligosaccharide repeat unit polymerase
MQTLTLLVALAMLLLPLALMRVPAAGASAGLPHVPRPLDLGALFAWVVAIYGALPLIGIELARAGIGTIAEQRLGLTVPDAEPVLQVGVVHLMFLLGVVVGYGALRPRQATLSADTLVRPRSSDVAWAVGLYLATIVTLALVRLAYGLGGGDDYLASYAEVYALPLLVQQLFGVLSAIEFALAVLCIVATIAWRPRAHLIVAAVVVALVAQSFIFGGSRTYAFLCGLAYVVARSIYGPRLRWSALLAYFVLGVLAFLLAGAVRQLRMADEAVSALGLLQGGEFVAYFYTGLDVLERAPDFEALGVSGALYFVDLLRLLPRQIVGEVKLDPAVLYVSTFYPEFFEAGGGLAFGAIAESVLGFGAPEALVRGLLLGAAYAWVRNGLRKPRVGVLRVFVYAWFVVLAYQGLRDTTFSVFARFVFQVLPILLFCHLAGVFRLRGRKAAAARPALVLKEAS